MARPTVIKKYGNRRLYDTSESRYITLEELADKIRDGGEVRVVAAKTNEDLTQSTLTQIIVESRGAAHLLPVPLLHQLIRLQDDSLAEFFENYVSAALDLYLRAKRGAQAIAPLNPFAQLPFAAGNALARLFMGQPFGGGGYDAPPPAPEPPPPAHSADRDDIDALRRELDELKRSVAGAARKGRKGR